MGFFSSLGSILKPVTSVVGGIFGLDSQKNANAANQAFADSQFNFQKDYIQNQIQWKVEDAKKAGVHPMAALGVQSPGFSPVSSTQAPLDYSWVGDLGQSANYAATKAKTTPQQQQMIDLQIRGLELDNEYKQAQIDQMKVDTLASSIASNQAFSSPPAPSISPTGLIPGQTGSQLTSPEPMRTTPHTSPGKEPGSNPVTGWLMNSDGSVSPVMSEAAKERLEDDFVGELMWTAGNRVLPHLKWVTGFGDMASHYPPDSLLPKGAKGWRYNGFGRYVPVMR